MIYYIIYLLHSPCLYSSYRFIFFGEQWEQPLAQLPEQLAFPFMMLRIASPKANNRTPNTSIVAIIPSF